jgi:Flp pilus assembly protein TadG
LLIVTGIFVFGVALSHYLMLVNALDIGARQLAISRQQTTDPCAQFVATFEAAAPSLTPASLTFAYTLNGTAYSGTSCSSGSTTTGAAGNLVQGTSAQVTVTYPCSLAVYGINLVPSCTEVGITTELIQ